MTGKLIIVVEDDDMDSGCLHDILTECSEHGKVLEAHCTGTSEGGVPYDNDIMHMLEGIEQGPIPGKC